MKIEYVGSQSHISIISDKIPAGTWFTGEIRSQPHGLFLKAGGNIISLSNPKSWVWNEPWVTVINYRPIPSNQITIKIPKED